MMMLKSHRGLKRGCWEGANDEAVRRQGLTRNCAILEVEYCARDHTYPGEEPEMMQNRWAWFEKTQVCDSSNVKLYNIVIVVRFTMAVCGKHRSMASSSPAMKDKLDQDGNAGGLNNSKSDSVKSETRDYTIF